MNAAESVVELDGGRTVTAKVSNMAPALAYIYYLGSIDPQYAGKGLPLFGNHPIEDFAQRMLAGSRAVAWRIAGTLSR